MLHLLPVTKWQKGNQHKGEMMSYDSIACKYMQMAWNSTGLPFSFQGSLRLFQCLDQILFFQSQPVHSTNRVQMEKKRQDYVHLCMFRFPLSPFSAWFVAPCNMLNVRLQLFSLWWLFSDLLIARGATSNGLYDASYVDHRPKTNGPENPTCQLLPITSSTAQAVAEVSK